MEKSDNVPQVLLVCCVCRGWGFRPPFGGHLFYPSTCLLGSMYAKQADCLPDVAGTAGREPSLRACIKAIQTGQ